MSSIDVAARFILVVLSAASFVPQVSRIRRRGECVGISLLYIILNLIISTYHFSLALDFVAINWEGNYLVHQPPDLSDWLNLLQFAVVLIGHLVLLGHALQLPPQRPVQKNVVTIIYISFLAISLIPIAFGATIPQHERLWFSSLITGGLLFFFGPVVQILGVAALFVQARETIQRGSPGALSIKTLTAQALVFLLVGISFMFRLTIPNEGWECPGTWWQCTTIRLRKWYWQVGWATINNIIFAIAQGFLAVIASRRGTADDAEREPLLSS